MGKRGDLLFTDKGENILVQTEGAKQQDSLKRAYAYSNAFNKERYQRVILNLKKGVAENIKDYVTCTYPGITVTNYIKTLICRDVMERASAEEYEAIYNEIYGDVPKESMDSYISPDYKK